MRHRGLLIACILGLGLWMAWRPRPSAVEPTREPAAAELDPAPLRIPAEPLSDGPPTPGPVPDMDVVEEALERLAELEGASKIHCPEPGFPVGKAPFVRWVQGPDGLTALVEEVAGTGLLFRAGLRDLPGVEPEALVRWGAGRCEVESVEWGVIRGVVQGPSGPRGHSWVVGCGVAMWPVASDGTFSLSAPADTMCQLQAEGRGEGVWVVPEASRGQDVVVPWTPSQASEREQVVARMEQELEALDAREAQPSPMERALQDASLREETRALLEAWYAESLAQEQARREWLERVLQRYDGPPPSVESEDAPDVWPVPTR